MQTPLQWSIEVLPQHQAGNDPARGEAHHGGALKEACSIAGEKLFDVFKRRDADAAFSRAGFCAAAYLAADGYGSRTARIVTLDGERETRSLFYRWERVSQNVRTLNLATRAAAYAFVKLSASPDARGRRIGTRSVPS